MNIMLHLYTFTSAVVILSFIIFSSSVGINKDQHIYGAVIDTDQELKITEELSYSSVSLNSELSTNNSNENNESSQSNVYSNPPFVFFDNKSSMISLGLHSFWKDQGLSCLNQFRCETDRSTGWNDDNSFRVSSADNSNRTRAMFYGKSIDVTPQKQYQFVSHMKMSEWARQSRVVLEGFDEGTRNWNRIQECPSGVNGPIDWNEYKCHVKIPNNTTKVRPVLNAGYSSNPEEKAITWFDTIYLIRTDNPFILSGDLKAELVFKGLNRPTSMEFSGKNTILVTEKNTGKVIEIKDGTANSTLLDLNVAVLGERGLLGVAVASKSNTNPEEDDDNEARDNESNGDDNSNNDKYVFLYYTEAMDHDGDDREGNNPIGNRLTRYELIDGSLKNPKLVLELPAGYHHNGGKILTGNDRDLYLSVGELDDLSTKAHKSSKALNFKGLNPDGRGGILHLNYDGDGIDGGILGNNPPLDKYFAYGIRNSFGLDFDPVTGNLWDTENGPSYGDEINLVGPGFNSGWRTVQGMWTVESGEKEGKWLSERPSNLEDFGNKGKYSTPEFSWKKTVGPTAIKFLDTDELGKEYENDLLVSDVNGRVYHFDLNENRTGLLLNAQLKNKVAESDNEFNSVVFFEGQGTLITDLDIGPDGNLYLLDHVGGKIYRITSNADGNLLAELESASRNDFAN
jgi:glucose/arabinose dehydrogenase